MPATKARTTKTLVVRLLLRRDWETGSIGGTGVLEVGDVAAASAIALAVAAVFDCCLLWVVDSLRRGWRADWPLLIPLAAEMQRRAREPEARLRDRPGKGEVVSGALGANITAAAGASRGS